MSNTIDNILKFTPLIGFLLIGSGFVKLMIYYKAFKLRIFSFLSLQEVLVSFTDNLIAYFFILTLTFITGFIFYNNLETSGLVLETLRNMGFLERSLAYLNANLNIIIIIIILNIGAVLFWKLRGNIFKYEAFLIVIVLWISLFIVPIIINEMSLIQFINNKEQLDFSYLILIMAAIALFFYVIGSAYNEINKVKNFNYFEGSEFIVDGKEIKSTKKYYYIGQTRNYIFFYNSKAGKSEVYPIDKVNRFKFVR